MQTNLTLGLGSNEIGQKTKQVIESEAKKRGMSMSQFILYCVQETIKKEKKS